MAKKPVKRTKRATVKTRATSKSVKKVAQKPKKAKTKSKSSTKEWLVPVLELEHYKPRIKKETGVQNQNKGSTRYAWTGEHGAGKDMKRGERAVQQHQQEILHLARKTFGTEVDHIMVCFGAGGGTGSGSVVGSIEIAKRYARYIGLENPNRKVGVIMTLPTVGEASSPLVAENAHRIATTLSQMAMSAEISPLIIIDNDRIKKMYPGMTVKSFWPSINSTVSSLFDIFNRLSSLNSRYTSFDAVDYRSIMESGGCAIMGLTKVRAFDDPYALSEAMKENLEKTLLAGGFNLSTANMAGCIVVGGKKLMAHTKGLQNNIDYAFDVLSEITGRATIHRGIYEDDRDSLRVYTIIGGLDSPSTRLEEISSCMAVCAH